MQINKKLRSPYLRVLCSDYNRLYPIISILFYSTELDPIISRICAVRHTATPLGRFGGRCGHDIPLDKKVTSKWLRRRFQKGLRRYLIRVAEATPVRREELLRRDFSKSLLSDFWKCIRSHICSHRATLRLGRNFSVFVERDNNNITMLYN